MFTIKPHIALLNIAVACIIAGGFFACSGDHESAMIKDPEPMKFEIPDHFPPTVYDLKNNPVTNEGFALGRKLFYDARLSRTNNISCGECHQQSFAFTHHGHTVSHGVDDLLGKRNSLPIQNLLFYNSFFWDGGVHNLDLIPLNAIGNKVELDETTQQIIAKLQADEKYPAMFRAAFGSAEITNENFLKALAQFLAPIISSSSRYDLYVKGNTQMLNDSEIKGLALFEQNCASCHATALFTDQSYRNNGFSNASDIAKDKGRAEITLNDEDIGKFKVPSLRNVEYSGPYMHNGKLATLEAVLNFYTDGVQASATLDPLLNRHEKPGIILDDDDKKNIIAFLKTLTDETFLSDKRFSEF